MNVPVFYLRKPIYILIRHAKEKGKDYDTFGAKIKEPAKCIVDRPSALLKTEEEIFVMEQKLSFENFYSITNYVGEFWLGVHNYWISRKSDFTKEAFKNTATFRKNLVNNSPIHTDAFKALCDYDKTDDGQASNLPNKLVLAICYLAEMAASDLEHSADTDGAQVKRIIEKIKTLNENSRFHEQTENTATKHNKFWQTGEGFDKRLPKIFYGSNWACYERTDGITRINAKWGIALSTVEIGKSNLKGYTQIVLKSDYVSGKSVHTGVVTVDEDSGHLIAHLTRDDEQLQTPAFFIMRLNDMMLNTHGVEDALLVGHFSHYSVYYGSFLTKTVVWLRADSRLIQKKFAELPKDIALADESLEFADYLPQFIRTFLHNRLRNRLTMPSSNLTNADEHDWRHSIQHWLSKKNKNIEKDFVLDLCTGDYFVCYYYGDEIGAKNKAIDDFDIQFVRIDELHIAYNKDSAEFEVEYTHKREASPTEESQSSVAKASYRGVARRRNSTVQIILNEGSETLNIGNLAEGTAEANYVYLAFCTPVIHKVAQIEFERHEYFPGIISGLNDSNNEPITFKMVVVQRKKLLPGDDSILSEQHEFKFADCLDNRVNNVARRIIRYFKINPNNRSIKVEAQSNKFADLYPNLEELRIAGGSYEIRCEVEEYKIECHHKNNPHLVLKASDLDALLLKADGAVSNWKL